MTPAKFDSSNCRTGDLVNVHIKSFNQNSLFGKIENDNMRAA